ncbi:Hypp6230 [Branchiostoma lanceolatum]|uniref:Hypp6230 protein n=1 Tax=Branchiostoma lanceolatum TaxID=7740 RepID=A0A8J9YQ55_BRALA|nr:Hypp6230 [Branchiostoma lanceolatum]
MLVATCTAERYVGAVFLHRVDVLRAESGDDGYVLLVTGLVINFDMFLDVSGTNHAGSARKTESGRSSSRSNELSALCAILQTRLQSDAKYRASHTRQRRAEHQLFSERLPPQTTILSGPAGILGRSVFVPFVDGMVEQLASRFQQLSAHACRALLLIPSNLDNLQEDHIMQLQQYYEPNLPSPLSFR